VKKLIITESDRENILKMYGLLNEGIREQLPSDIQKAIKKVEDKYGVKITEDNLSAERNQEKVDYYEDNGRLDPKAKSQLQKLLSALYSEFKDAPKRINSNCDNIVGCVSGYRGYSLQASVFGGKIKNGDVAYRQKVSAMPGFSQHHTGKAFDIIDLDDPFWEENPKVKKWVEDNVGKYGFKISYPTQGSLRSAEPWHIFYIGGEESDENINQEKQEKIEKKVDDYYASDKDNPQVEQKIEKRYEMVGCSPKREYTEAPTLDQVKSDSSVVIRIGHKGAPVEEIQKKLTDLGYDVGRCGIDSLFGPKTKKALESFQEDNGIDVSSAINKETLEKFSSPSKDKVETKNKKSETKTDKKDDSSKVSTDSDYYVIIPNGYTGGEAHVLFGGAHSFYKGEVKPDYLKKFGDVVAKYVKDKIIISTHHKTTLNTVTEYAKQKFDANVTSIAGFSQGGKETWKHKDNTSLRLVGLIDPSTYDTDLSLGANTYLYANPSNWGTTGFLGETRQRLKWYCEHKNDNKYKGHVFCPSVSHVGMVDEFYSNYASKI
jgi:LAS superfamily LD-carboxypeptidase LdcB